MRAFGGMDPAEARDIMAEAMRVDADDAPDSWSRKVWPHRADVALAALTARGHAVVKLPGQCEIPASWDGDCLGAWQGPSLKEPVSLWPQYGREPHIAMPDGSFVSLQDARDLAGALVAALKAAEAAR